MVFIFWMLLKEPSIPQPQSFKHFHLYIFLVFTMFLFSSFIWVICMFWCLAIWYFHLACEEEKGFIHCLNICSFPHLSWMAQLLHIKFIYIHRIVSLTTFQFLYYHNLFQQWKITLCLYAMNKIIYLIIILCIKVF